jgi:UDP-GlcNAc:undecaprenyl-phosphate GlcNAc-1-phosphate transferase
MFLVFLIKIGRKIKWQGRNSERHIHKKGKVFRVGGIAMILSFNIAILVNKDLFITMELYGFMVASLIILIVGIWDDIKEIYWKVQLFFQIAVAILIFVLGIRIYYITNPLTGGIIHLEQGLGIIISVFLVIFWIVLVTNVINWLDGIDGLSGGLTFIVAITIFILSLRPEVNQPPVAIIAAVFAGSVLGFLVFNFNPSKVIAGTSGAMFMGFSLAVISIFSGTKIATALLVLSVPVLDCLWVIAERIKRGQPIFRPDKSHFHYRLLDLGWSQRKINLLFFTITILISIVALNTRALGKILTLAVVAIIMLFSFVFIKRKLDKKQ